jgi:hypothetical protein
MDENFETPVVVTEPAVGVATPEPEEIKEAVKEAIVEAEEIKEEKIQEKMKEAEFE